MALLIGLYYLYKRIPKERQHLLRSFDALDIPVQLPTRVGGTWWLPHLEEAVEVFFGSYKAIVSHLQNSSHKNAKTEGLARAALSANIVVFLLELKVIKIY